MVRCPWSWRPSVSDWPICGPRALSMVSGQWPAHLGASVVTDRCRDRPQPHGNVAHIFITYMHECNCIACRPTHTGSHPTAQTHLHTWNRRPPCAHTVHSYLPAQACLGNELLDFLPGLGLGRAVDIHMEILSDKPAMTNDGCLCLWMH